MAEQLKATPHVANVKSPYAPANGPTQISKDGRTVRVDFEVPGKDKLMQEKNVEDSTKTIAALQKSPIRTCGSSSSAARARTRRSTRP